ncbi:ATP-binding cassette domain-containing protein [Brachybacterium fresconis]|uniref:Peptide/nickel transport system ATP-binding protein n=1 Tax=Brachybacterium fresconis TaxID=173363 RepID=A0ABS4YLT6_9MICO|nr:ABC transporter ATP-binding protein [Brachybacterium fresconis]MBP2409714.1 peptide/nickel transport system ATP-binding protein [Brachybacterium fresconis]
MSTADELLVLHDLQVSIAGRSIVTGLDLTVRAGRITALVGESGSGKSMTALATIGLQPRGAEARGGARLDGDELVGRSAPEMRQIRSGRIGMIFQEPGQSLSPVMKVSTGFRHGLAVREGIRSRAHAAQRTRELLASVGLPDPDRTAASYPHELSGGELQRVVIALALSGDPSLLIADEPTTALDVTVQRGILELLVRIVRERQIGILLITHDMGVVGEIADEVVVLKDGDVVETGPVRQVLSAPDAPYTQALLSAVPRLAESLERADGGAVPEQREGEHPVVRVEGLTVEYHRRGGSHRALEDVGTEIRRGEIHGLVGESGSGKSTWGKALAGLVPAQARTLEIEGVDPRTLGAAQRRAAYARVGLVFQDPASSLNPRRTVGWSIGEPLQLAGGISRTDIARRVKRALEIVHLPASYVSRLPHELSGGQRQRVSIARALILEPALLIADEPTSALDVTIQAHVIDVLRDAIEETRFACVFISHDLAVVGTLADRVTVLQAGKAVEQGAARDVLGNPQHEYTRTLLASVPDPARRLRAGDRPAA